MEKQTRREMRKPGGVSPGIEDVSLPVELLEVGFRTRALFEEAVQIVGGNRAQCGHLAFKTQICKPPFLVIPAESSLIRGEESIHAADEQGRENGLNRVRAEEKHNGWKPVLLDLREQEVTGDIPGRSHDVDRPSSAKAFFRDEVDGTVDTDRP